MITIRQMKLSEIERTAEIDRSQHVTKACVIRNGSLKLEDVDCVVPTWSSGSEGEHSIGAKTSAWRRTLHRGGVMLGAFDGQRLVGFAIYRPDLSEETAELSALHVTKSHRRRGIGSALAGKIIQLAEADGAKKLYVSSAPTAAAVNFYKDHGFDLAEEVNQELYRLKPDDIHMTRAL